MTGTEIYKRTSIYEREARKIRLHAPQWKLLLAFDGERTLAQVALSAQAPFAEAIPLTQKFLDHGWIEEQPITLDQYLVRSGVSDLTEAGAVVPPATILHQPKAAGIPPLPTTARGKVQPVAAVRAPQPAQPSRPMRLSAVVDFITSLVGNISIGQLLVYRVFLRVPPELLLAEEISSVLLVGDTSIIQGQKLQQAIADAVHAVSQRALPESVYATA